MPGPSSQRVADCPFCRIAAGGSTTHVVGETPDTVALFPIAPATIGHTLVIPRTHVPDIWALEQAQARPLTDEVLRVAHGIRAALRPDGLNVITSSGRAASQTVPHLHVHLVPRWDGDAFGELWPRPSPRLPGDELDGAARAIRDVLAP